MASSELEHIQKVWAKLKEDSPIYGLLLPTIEIVFATKGLITARLQLLPIHINSKGILHGAVSAAIVDWAGSMAISSHGLEKNGLSTDIHVTYITAARLGEWIEVEGKANRVGGTFGFTTVTIAKVEDGKAGAIVATGSHTKFIRP
ncbi:MAG: hypothetical protein M1824_004420 [Vezdaea acicularis]|nr:MAG: hypothetical protein M1824_004420 [Vezdaea acicularis]